MTEIDLRRSRIDRELESAQARRRSDRSQAPSARRSRTPLRRLGQLTADATRGSPADGPWATAPPTRRTHGPERAEPSDEARFTDGDATHARARARLGRLSTLEATLARAAHLPAERERARRLSELQGRARALARELAVGELAPDAPAADVQRMSTELEAELSRCEDEARDFEAKADATRRAMSELTDERALARRAELEHPTAHDSGARAATRAPAPHPEDVTAARKLVAQEAAERRERTRSGGGGRAAEASALQRRAAPSIQSSPSSATSSTPSWPTASTT